MVNIILGPIGFCFGVSKAVEEIEKRLLKKEKLFSDGEVIHNKNVVEKLQQLGLVIEKE
ncbi:MAG TPA: 4-hydroxy-3-methylbut-2-enyl diphosphate reductase, partial [Fervidobacterium sp.]|nr:4-hydroxy-3-methylbut-2-enyl diphosphate reductase [Fervidobacterium sp.]